LIIITGGAGFIGSNLVAGLEAAGEAGLVVCDRLGCAEKWRNLGRRLPADIVPPERLFEAIAACGPALSGVFHLGAISDTTARDGDAVVETNFRLSVALWRECARLGVPFYYASSAAVYGDGSRGFADGNDPGQLRGLRPLNLYGWSKWLFDGWVLAALARGEPAPPAWAGLRFFNVYGPNEYHKGAMQSLVAKIIAAHQPGAPVRLFKSYRDGIADGDQARDFIHVDDAVAVMLWLWQGRRTAGIVNVGTGVARSFRDLAEAAMLAAGEAPMIAFIDMPESIRDAYQYYTCADMRRLRALGFAHAFRTLEAGVGGYVRDYLLTAEPYR
jgi:ADP-L-glycero-D-manno-heptose 6-epimerase